MNPIYAIIFYITLVCFAVNFYSCKKLTGAGNIKGKVLTKGTDKPVHAALVEVFSKERDIFSSLATKEGEGWTAADGSFSIDYDAPSGRLIYVMASSVGYVRDLTNDIVYKDGNKKLEVKLIPEAWLKLHLKNVNKNSDWISVAVDASRLNIYGDNIDTFMNLRVRGNQIMPIKWKVVKDLTFQNYEDEIYCPGHDTTYYEILY